MLIVSGAVPAEPVAEIFDTSMTVSAETTTVSGISLTDDERIFLIEEGTVYEFQENAGVTVYLGDQSPFNKTEPPTVTGNNVANVPAEFREGNSNYYVCKPV